MKRNDTLRYTLFGALVGFLFPVFATILDVSIIHGKHLTFVNIISAQINNPLLWIIDSAPIILGVFARFAGKRQDTLSEQHVTLNELIESKTLLSNELETAAAELETTVEQRTKELEKRNRYLEASTIVAQDATSIHEPQELLEHTASLISEQFDFYHVGFFLVDADNEWAILKAVSSDGGKQMLARDHRLMVGKQGIVGYVTGIGQARISQDIGLDRIHSVTPELPETRSEMALPLKVRNQIIGALDIQDKRENAFSESDVNILQTLANQIALAIDNARLYQQAQANVHEIQNILGDTSLQSLKASYQGGDLPAYKFEAMESSDVQKVDPEDLSDQPEPGTIEIPINVRGQTIGSIDIIREETTEDWSEEESNVLEILSEQLGVAIDSARLFEETQSRAKTEQIISDVSSEIRETLDINTILKTTAEKVRQIMNLPEVTIRLADPTAPKTTNGDSSKGSS
jgi:GAF domain-containing protein